jgi:hypothetical protein
MSLFLDQKYLSLISNRLPLFKRKDDHLYNCRCVICGDSVKKRNKARGYFFKYKNELRFKCHNCDASMSFSAFLKQLDSNLHTQYRLEKYSEGQTTSTKAPEIVFTEPKFQTKEEKLLDKILDRLDKLPEDNEGVQFCKKRQIPIEKYNQIYFIENVKDIVQLNDKYKESIKGEEPRIVLPFFNEDGQLAGVTCRALRGEALRYITVKIKDDVPLIFGLNELDLKKTIYVVEGPLDSLFLPNSVAVAGTALNKSTHLLSKDVVFVYDNQPRNKEVCKLIEKSISAGNKIVIWPQHIEEKDINDMVLAGHNVKKIVENNTWKDLTAKAKFIAWKRC